MSLTERTARRPHPTSPDGPRPAGRRIPRARRRRHPLAATAAIAFSAIWVFPVYWMVLTAFKPRSEVMTPTPLFWPRTPTLSNFVAAITQSGFFDALRTSVIVVFITLILAIVIGMLASAALSRFRFRFRRTIMVLILVIQMLPSTVLLIPQFLIFNDIGLVGSYAGLILAYVATVLPFSIWVMRGFFVVIPVEVEEAAMVDGAGTWRVMWSVLFPLVMPGVIATSVFAFIQAWNDYLVAYTFMKDPSRYTLPVWLSSFTTPTTGTDYGGQMAGSVIFALPVVVFFLIIQRRLVTGISAGAVKG